MNDDLIFKNIAKHIQLDDKEIAFFKGLLVLKKIKKKHFFLEEGDVARYTAFVLSGCLRDYTIDSNGNEHVLSFAPVDWWITDLYSLLSGKPAYLNIEALEDSEVLLLSKADQDILYDKIPKFERFFRIIIENSLVAHQQRLLDHLTHSAQERYSEFCKKYPTLVNSLPQKYIASYIGVTPEFFSKMRHEFLKNMD
jgi:CRP-like cAMP-binding protein